VYPKLIAADKTIYIEPLDKLPKYEFMFLRPRRWGKSTFLDTLANYYDKSKQDHFDQLFCDSTLAYIPPPAVARSSSFALIFHLSGLPETTYQFHGYMYDTLIRFLRTNQRFLHPVDFTIVNRNDGSGSLDSLLVCHLDSFENLTLTWAVVDTGEDPGPNAFCWSRRV
jgi:hypothetical protein